jgi:hypothetical protein
VARADAIGARIACADDRHVLPGCYDCGLVRDVVTLAQAVLLPQKLHGEMDASQLASRNAQVPRLLCPTREQNRVELFPKAFRSNVHANMGVRLKANPFALHLLQTAVDQVLLQPEARNTAA